MLFAESFSAPAAAAAAASGFFYEAFKGRANLANLSKGMIFLGGVRVEWEGGLSAAGPLCQRFSLFYFSPCWVSEGQRNRYEGLTSQLTVRIKLNK